MLKRRTWILIILGCILVALPLARLTIRRANPAPAPLASGGSGMVAPRLPLTTPRNACTQMYHTICQKRGETRDPTGMVRPDVDGEIQALRTYETIIHEHPDWNVERVDQELVDQIYTPKRRNRLQSAFRWVESTLEKFINRQSNEVFTAVEKKQLIYRLRHMELQLPPPAAVYADEPDLYTKNDVFYEPLNDGHSRLRVGGAYLLTAKSWFNLVFTIAHEFGHAIDPCELRAAHMEMPAFDRISACFIAHGLVAARKTRHECGENDQLSETFADWLAVEAVSEALKHFATEFRGSQLVSAATNAVRDLCEQDEDDLNGGMDLEFHPSPEIRIDRIFARNPNIREVLGCEALSAENDPFSDYCGFEFKPPPILGPFQLPSSLRKNL